MIICGSCQTSNSPKAKSCVKCGENLRPEGAAAQTRTIGTEKSEKPVVVETQKRVSRRKIGDLVAPSEEAPIVPARQNKQKLQAAAPSNDLAPLLAEERKFLSAQLEQGPEAEIPVDLFLNFPHVFVAGYG